MKIMCSVNYILGMDVWNSFEVHTVHLSYLIYINKLITFNNMRFYVWHTYALKSNVIYGTMHS